MISPRPEWSAVYYDGRTAERQRVTVTAEAAGLRIARPDGSLVEWPFDGLRQTQGAFGAEQLRIEFGADPVEVLLIAGEGLPEAVRALSPRAFGRLRPRRSTAGVVGWSLGALAVAGAAYAAGAPVMADWAAPRVPVAWEETLGQTAADRLAPAEQLCTDSAALAELRVVVDRLVAALPASSPYRFRVYVVRDSVVNAFAAPGGVVVLHTGLLAAAKTPEELAGVLAHEIQHVVLRHSTRAVIREAPLRLALATLSGGSGIETAAGVVGTLGALRHRRADEAAADSGGMRLLEAAAVDAAGMAAFMRTLEPRGGEGGRLVSYLSTHPHTGDRIAALEAMAALHRAETRPVLDIGAWRRVKTMCTEDGSTLGRSASGSP